MALTAYAYNFSDTLTGRFDRLRLENQIIYTRNYGFSDFTIVFDRIDVNDFGETFTIWFKNELPVEEVTVLNSIVAAHRGDALYPTLKFKLDSPAEDDSRPNIVINPAPFYWRTCFSGAGDNKNAIFPSSGRGEGQSILVEFDEPGDGYVELEFIEPVYVHDCEASWAPAASWGPKDKLNISVEVPANVVVPNGSNTGNVHLVPTGFGFNAIVPAVGNGAYDINLATASPAPVIKNGYWEVQAETGQITVSSNLGASDWQLFDIPFSSAYIKNISLGNPLGVLDVETYKVDYIHPAWKIKVSVHKETVGAGYLCGWFMCFRQYLS